MKSRIAAISMLVALGCANTPRVESAAADQRSIAFSRHTMGTVATIRVVHADSLVISGDAASALDRFSYVDSLMSNWTQFSETARINREAAAGTVIHPELATVLRVALRVGDESGGAFDITVEPLVRLWGFLGGSPAVPDRAAIEELLPRIGRQQIAFDADLRQLKFQHEQLRIDLGGVAKGYGVDLAAIQLRSLGIENALIDLSGNMIALGQPFGRPHWTVGVRDPSQRFPFFARLALGDEAIATSGDYEQFVAQNGKRYGHILDPRTGFPTSSLAQVTVLAPTATEADAWATAIFVLGPEKARETHSGQTKVRGTCRPSKINRIARPAGYSRRDRQANAQAESQDQTRAQARGGAGQRQAGQRTGTARS